MRKENDMEKLRNGKFLHQIATNEEVASFASAANAMIEKYGWQDRKVWPYSYPEKVTKIVNELKDFPACTFGSKQYLITLANGLADILEAWEKQELEPKLTIRIVRNGKIVECGEDIARQLIEDGVAEAV